MRTSPVLILLLLLCDGRPGLTRTDTKVLKVTEGENIRANCLFYFKAKKKIFCKNDCNKKENILVETSGYSQQNDRYSIEHKKDLGGYHKMYVSITNVRRSDSGRYSCGVDYGQRDATIVEFMIKVLNAPTSSVPTFTLRPAVTTLLYNVTTAQQTVLPSEVTTPPERQEQNSTPLSGVLLYVGLTAVVIMISVTLFILCWKNRANKPKEQPAAAEYCEIPETNRLYEEIPGENRPGPVEMCTASVSASFCNTTETSEIYSLASAPSGQLQANRLYEEIPGENRAAPVEMCTASVSASFRKTTETSEIYSLASAPREQLQTEDSSTKAIYSELDFTKSSGPEVLLYSTVTLPQQLPS